jgi:hypothetical protein
MKKSKFEIQLEKNNISEMDYKMARMLLWLKNYGTYIKIDKDFSSGVLVWNEKELVKIKDAEMAIK